jgi:hypothetical protein
MVHVRLLETFVACILRKAEVQQAGSIAEVTVCAASEHCLDNRNMGNELAIVIVMYFCIFNGLAHRPRFAWPPVNDRSAHVLWRITHII